MNTLKNWLWISIAIVVLALAWAVWQFGFFNRPITEKSAPPLVKGAPPSAGNTAPEEGVSPLVNDTTAEIGKDLNAVDIGNPDGDLKKLDADLNQL